MIDNTDIIIYLNRIKTLLEKNERMKNFFYGGEDLEEFLNMVSDFAKKNYIRYNLF